METLPMPADTSLEILTFFLWEILCSHSLRAFRHIPYLAGLLLTHGSPVLLLAIERTLDNLSMAYGRQ